MWKRGQDRQRCCPQVYAEFWAPFKALRLNATSFSVTAIPTETDGTSGERRESQRVKIIPGWGDNGPISCKAVELLVYCSEAEGADICGHNKK